MSSGTQASGDKQIDLIADVAVDRAINDGEAPDAYPDLRERVVRQVLTTGRRRTVLAWVLAVYVGSFLFGWLQGRITAIVVQRTVYRLRGEVRRPLNDEAKGWRGLRGSRRRGFYRSGRRREFRSIDPDPELSTGASGEFIRHRPEIFYSADLRTIHVPVLLLWGEQDRMVPFANARDYLEALSNAWRGFLRDRLAQMEV